VRNADDFAKVLVLDVLVDNGDRHDKNILLTAADTEGSWRFWAIDFDGARVGGPWDGDTSNSPTIPEQCPPGMWLSEVPWAVLEGPLAQAVSSLQALLARTDYVYQIAETALMAAEGTAPSVARVDSLVEYLEWRGQAAHTMAVAYWEKAVSNG
jgi:hypothetical protein